MLLLPPVTEVPHPATAGLSAIAAGLGTVVAVAATAITEYPEVRAILFIGGVAMALLGIGALARNIYRGGMWGLRAADGMAELMGDPKANPPVPGLGDRMERMEATVDDVQHTLKAKVEDDRVRWDKVDAMHEVQGEIVAMLETLLDGDAQRTTQMRVDAAEARGPQARGPQVQVVVDHGKEKGKL